MAPVRFSLLHDIVMIILSVATAAGARTFAQPCPPKPDGGFMVCHWAGEAVCAIGIVLVGLSLVHALNKNHGVKLGISIAIMITALLSAAVPGGVISLCMKEDMRCHLIMKPSIMVLGGLLAVTALVKIWLIRKHENQGEIPT